MDVYAFIENSKKSICVRNAHNIENIHTYGYVIQGNALNIIFIMIISIQVPLF